MGWKSFLAGTVVGAIGTYWGSEKVNESVTDALQKSEQLLHNQEAINNACYQQIAKWYHNGELGTVINVIQQQNAARQMGINPQMYGPQNRR